MDIKGGGKGVNIFQKFFSSLEILLGLFEALFGGMFILNMLKQKVPHGCPKPEGGVGGLSLHP